MNFSPAQQAHVRIMRAVLSALQNTPLVLKGGTSLLLCHGLDRFSEDLDFDSPKRLNLESRVGHALRALTTDLRITRTKNTDTVQRYRIEYSNADIQGRLKVEISFRDTITSEDITERNNIRTYRVARLIEQKINAPENRTTARDLYDVHFLATHFRPDFGEHSLTRLRELTSDVNRLEGRFRPAFEDDDLFRDKTDLVPGLILAIQNSVG